ncbi:GNAT family N-acetyltransferase [bacterium 210917-DFI.7.65]|nr:GNAT family N-acetyltransferase [Clostridiales bacterium]MCB6899832.1 GNAT family N-acetyltransferase [bacterium 210917-DFI.7.65]
MCLHFETVTAKNRGAVERLALLPEQAGFIESPAECLREADASDFWRPVGIYDGTELVGFAMYGYLPFLGEGQLWFDRLLIDKAFQGRGYAKAAIAALLERLRQEYPCRRVYLSVYGDNAAAIHLYRQAGFSFNGDYDTKGERVMVLDFPETGPAET